ncbi:hypothetical protein GCM10009119_21350 [Algoriphagus jejuensis]|uniref:Uncharacterized protein n=1 Tax=Algoriphagus jejuensis TaxID=419934 RepID=A0ABN1N062_9BACT
MGLDEEFQKDFVSEQIKALNSAGNYFKDDIESLMLGLTVDFSDEDFELNCLIFMSAFGYADAHFFSKRS